MVSLTESSSYQKKLHLQFLYLLLAVQFCYILVDRLAYHKDDPWLACVCNCPRSPLQRTKVSLQNPAARECSTKEDYYLEGGKEKTKEEHEEDPWRQMKWIGSPSACTVKGLPIEKLDDELNFRRGYALRFVEDVEDKTHLLPWLLGSKVNLNSRKRRVYLDLGANRFTTSVRWFLRMYPCDFTEVHAFEANPRSWRAPKTDFDEQENEMLGFTEGGKNDSIFVKKTPGVPKWMMNRVQVHFSKVAHFDDPSRGFINITKFIKDELALTPQDALVVKLDIEGSEWPILRDWMDDPDMPHIVDELFLEIHYAHPSMSAFGWDSFLPITRDQAKSLLAELRSKGFYAHAWP